MIKPLSIFTFLNQFYNASILDKTWLFMVGWIQCQIRRYNFNLYLFLVRHQKTKNALTAKLTWKTTLVQFLNLECFTLVRNLTKLCIAQHRFGTVPILSSIILSPINPIISLLKLTYTKSRTILIGSNLGSITCINTLHFR